LKILDKLQIEQTLKSSLLSSERWSIESSLVTSS